jgi:hypothetical protein
MERFMCVCSVMCFDVVCFDVMRCGVMCSVFSKWKYLEGSLQLLTT